MAPFFKFIKMEKHQLKAGNFYTLSGLTWGENTYVIECIKDSKTKSYIQFDSDTKRIIDVGLNSDFVESDLYRLSTSDEIDLFIATLKDQKDYISPITKNIVDEYSVY